MNFVGPQTPKQPLRAYAGATFSVLARLWLDEEHTEPFSLVGWTVKFPIEGLRTLVEGMGLNISAVEGEIRVTLSDAETLDAANRSNRSFPYLLSIEKEGETFYLLSGPFVFAQTNSAQGTAVGEVDIAVIDPAAINLVIEEGAPGKEGPPGPEGPPGKEGPAGSGDLHYTFTQGSPSALWTIKHGLGKNPSVTVLDTAGDEVEGITEYLGLDELTITFSAPFSGEAYLN